MLISFWLIKQGVNYINVRVVVDKGYAILGNFLI